MAVASLTTSFDRSIRDIDILANYLNDLPSFDAKHQYLISEVIMLRLFSVYEIYVSEIALKLACGARYRNGTSPVVLIPCKSSLDAHTKMLSHGRAKSLQFLKWTTVKEVGKSINYVLDKSGTYYTRLQNHSVVINEMRIVRNEIAHRTSGTKQLFNTEMARIYGANVRLSMGAFLTSPKRHTLTNISRYALTVKVILDDITRG